MDNGYLGNNLRKLRQDNKISQNKLGDMLGVSGAYIQQLEKGVKTNPSIDLIYKISTYFDISPMKLLEWDLSNEHQDLAKENEISKLLRANALKNDANYNTKKNFKQLFAKPSEFFAGPGKLVSYGSEFAKVNNKRNEEMHLLYRFLESKYGSENINMNSTVDEEFINLNIGSDNITYTKEDFEKFIEYIVASFPNFKTIIDKTK